MKIRSEHVRWFRLRRSGLVAPFASATETACEVIGVQAQLPVAANIAFWNRMRGCTVADLEAARLERRELVRFWGQRNTVHVYTAADWPFLHTALAERRGLGEGKLEEAGLLGEFQRVLTRIRKRLEKGDVLTYKDVKSKKLEEGQDRWVVSYLTFMKLLRQGVCCHGADRGNESTFVHREHWLPDLDWSPPEPGETFPELARRYLACYGPAEPTDLAFWYGGTVTNAKRWIAEAGDDLVTVDVDGRQHWCRAEDLHELQAKPPAASRWPVKLLYRFDPLVLATKDKSWLVDDEHYKKVWRGSAHVEAVLLVHGRIAGTWRYDRKAKGLTVRVAPFAPLSRTVAKAMEREAEGVASFLDMPLAALEVSEPA